MIVEFIGCTGAGKTTVMREILRQADTSMPAVTAWDVTLDRPVLRRLTNPSLRNIAADVTAFVPSLRARRARKEFVSLARDRLRMHAPSTIARLNYARSIRRRLGMHQLVVESMPDMTVFVDEGTVLIAYLLFVYTEGAYSQSDLERFAALVPKPDVLVHVGAPVGVLMQRAKDRSDTRRELAGLDDSAIRKSIERAVAVFDGLASTSSVGPITVRVDNQGDSAVDLQRVAAEVVSAIHRLDSAGRRPTPEKYS